MEIEALAEEMAARWRLGESPRVEEFLRRHPGLLAEPEAVLELISEEIVLRQEIDQDEDLSDLPARFPHWRRQVEAVLECHRLLGEERPISQFPSTGDEVEGFRLIAELGRGAHGRVYLAAQANLADRPMVLKLVPANDLEYLTLARLQHTHIVPLYAVHHLPDHGMRALCMPYFGRLTLAGLLEFLHDTPPKERRGHDLVRALQDAETWSLAPLPIDGPACRFLTACSYEEAICWIGASIADALQHAGERELVHLDLKPSNVLLAADGQPMLLDFHLARAPLSAGTAAPPWLGGTPGYMAPEQEEALQATRLSGDLRLAVDGRADIYSLGLVLYELLGGPMPPAKNIAAALRSQNPNVTRGLADIVATCLATEPKDRYAAAAALAADLRCHLSDLPLRSVSNRSVTERWRKWQRRRPYIVPLTALLLLLTATAGICLAYVRHQTEKASVALETGQDQLAGEQYAEALGTFRHGLALIEDFPLTANIEARLREGMLRARSAQMALELHQFCERLRPLYAAEHVSVGQGTAVEAHCQCLWQDRQRIVGDLGRKCGPRLEAQLRGDLLDLVLIWTNLHVRLALPDRIADARKDALTTLDQAEDLFGNSVVLEQERQIHAQALGLPDRPIGRRPPPTPATAWEHYALGRTYLGIGDVARAAEEMEQALQKEPQSFWPNYYKGLCAFRQNQHADALAAFSACVVLSPRTAWAWYNRGLAYAELGRADLAQRDFDRAQELDPTFRLRAVVTGEGAQSFTQAGYRGARFQRNQP